MISSLSRIFTLTKRNLKEMTRDYLSIIFIIILPLIMEILFYLLFHDSAVQFEMKYLVPGIIAFSQAFLSLFIGSLIASDRSSSFLTRLFVTKTKSFEFIISYALSLVPLVMAQSLLFFLIGILFDFSLFRIEIIYCLLLSIITSLLFLGLGILFGTLCNERSVGGVASIIISAQSLLSGMWFPLEGLSDGFIKIMEILPFKNATILLQNSLNGSDYILSPLLIVLLYSIGVFLLAIIVYKSKMKSK